MSTVKSRAVKTRSFVTPRTSAAYVPGLFSFCATEHSEVKRATQRVGVFYFETGEKKPSHHLPAAPCDGGIKPEFKLRINK